MEGCCEADFAGFLGIYLDSRWLESGLGWGLGGCTPLRVDFAARLALALCLPPIGAMERRISKF